MQIFQNYTGSAFLNNSLQTIEALADLDHVSEITTDTLLDQYEKLNLTKLNKRLKSYTMVFTRNGPLHNDKNNGEAIYDLLMKKIIKDFENNGSQTCEISGLQFTKSFEQFFKEVLKEFGFSEKEIQKKDTSLNRCWFPLIGALGSDAQALPQAKFAVNIHPICVAILQFLPQSSVLYKGGILLLDSTNFDFTREYIKENCETVQDRIETTPNDQLVQNYSFGNKGHYLKKALAIYDEKLFDDDYSDLNLWSFTNSGTGASCTVERIPNNLFQRLSTLRETATLKEETDSFLVNYNYGDWFLEKFSGNLDFFALYPSKKYQGASIEFFNAYHELIGNKEILPFAQLAAHLLKKYGSKEDEKVLKKKDAHAESTYPPILLKALIEGAKNGEWNLNSHIFILDNPDRLPVKASKWRIHKMIHFYYQQSNLSVEKRNLIPDVNETTVGQVTALMIYLINNDQHRNRIINDVIDPHKHQQISLYRIFIKASNDINLQTIYNYFFEDFQIQKFWVLEFLRVYFSQKDKSLSPQINSQIFENQAEEIPELTNAKEFVDFYSDYYQSKYGSEENFPADKFSNHVVGLLNSVQSGADFYKWLMNAIENMTIFYKQAKREGVENADTKLEQLRNYPDNFIYAQDGKPILSFSRFAVTFYMNKQLQIFKNQKIDHYDSAVQ